MNKVKKQQYFSELYVTQAFLCPLSWNFPTTRSGDSCLMRHPSVLIVILDGFQSKLWIFFLNNVPYTLYS